MVLQQSQIKNNNNLSSSNNKEELERKIDSITKGLSRPYFNKILKELVKKNLENAIIICDYIIAEQIEINIQNSVRSKKEYERNLLFAMIESQQYQIDKRL